MARTYSRDSKGRFASGGSAGSGGSRPRSGSTRKPATARGRRQENERRAMAAVRAKGGPSAKALRSVMTAAKAREFYDRTGTGGTRKRPAPTGKGSARKAGGALVKREPPGALVPTRRTVTVNATPVQGPARKPRIADTLRAGLRELAQSDARFYREIEQLVGPIKVPKPKPARTPSTGGASGGSQRGSVTRALRSTLRDLARADAARLREIQDITRPTSAGAIGGSKGGKRKGVSGSSGGKALPGSKPRKPRKPRS